MELVYTYESTNRARIKGLYAACEAYNAEREAIHNAEQAGLPEAERTAYVQISDEAYLSARISDLLDSYARTFGVSVINSADFVLRFTASENAAITGSTDPNVQALVAKLKSHPTVDLTHVDTTNGVAYLAATGLISAERAGVILAA